MHDVTAAVLHNLACRDLSSTSSVAAIINIGVCVFARVQAQAPGELSDACQLR